MAALDTVLVSAVNPGAGGIAGTTTPSGDTLTVRNFAQTDKAFLENIIRMGTAAGFVGVTSPLLHDPIFGIRITPAESPSLFSLPPYLTQSLHPQDTFTVTISGGAAETDVALLQIYYTNLPGSNARLYMPADIMGNDKNVKPLRVAVTSSATIGAWSDTVITTTENILHANTDYAILGYMSNTALAAIAIRGIDTGNLRVGGPGATLELGTTDFFVKMSAATGRPHIPVFNAANANGTFASVAASTASVAATVEFICLELAHNLS